MNILVTRPLPGGETTANRLRALGHQVVLAPLLATEAVDWVAPDTPPAAILLTSAAAAQLTDLSAWHAIPVFAVGAATARAAADAGFADVRTDVRTDVWTGGGTMQALLDTVAAAGFTAILHLAGEDRTPVALPAGLTLTMRIVYRARLLPLAVEPDADWALLYSPRTAGHFAAEIDRLGHRRGSVSIAAISPAALAAAGPGWHHTVAATTPNEDALLAAIGVPCQ